MRLYTSEKKAETLQAAISDYIVSTSNHNSSNTAQNFGANTNLLTLACLGKRQEDIMDEIQVLLKEYTNFNQYINQYK